MVAIFACAFAYAALSVFWTADGTQGVLALVSLAAALLTGSVVLLLVRGDQRALTAFAGGVLVGSLGQLLIALVEVRTGSHLTYQFGGSAIQEYGIDNIEALYGATAWGTLGNPNDLGGFWLLSFAVLLSARAYGLQFGKATRLLAIACVAGVLTIGFTSLADARAFQLGVILIIAFHLVNFLTPARGSLRGPIVLIFLTFGLAWAAVKGPVLLSGLQAVGSGDAVRLKLFESGMSVAFQTGGLGRGLGTEKEMIDSSELITNFHNIIVQLAAEVGVIIALAFTIYLFALVISWALLTRLARTLGSQRSLALATLATSLLIYGVTSSGVLFSSLYWSFFAVTVLLASAGDKVQAMAPPLSGPEPTHTIEPAYPHSAS
jgi:hypothetical protein